MILGWKINALRAVGRQSMLPACLGSLLIVIEYILKVQP